MDTKTEAGLNYKQIDSESFLTEGLKIRMLVQKYVDSKGSDYSENVDDIMNLMQLVVGQKTFFILMAEKDGRGVGLLTAHAVTHDNIKAGAMIHIGVIDENVSRVESEDMLKTSMNALHDWAKELGMTSIFTQTKRQERPFDKMLLKYGWKKITTVYEKEITNGQAKTSTAATSRPASAGI